MFNTIYRGDAKVALTAAGAKLGIQDIHLEGTLTICLKELLDAPPFISGLSVFFANTPSIKMKWNGAATVLCLLKRTIRNIVRQQIDNVCVLPKRIAVVLDKSEPRLFRIKAPRPAGCLYLHLIKAEGLEGKDWNVFGKATSDPYAMMRVGGHDYKSTTKPKTCDPEWNESFTFFVFDQEQKFVMDLFDEDMGTGDDWLGRLNIPVKDVLQKCATGPAWFELGPDEDAGEEDATPVKGKVQLKAVWMPTFIDQAKAKAIVKASGDVPQSMTFLGLYSVKVPVAKVGTAYTIEVSCSGPFSKSYTIGKASAVPQDEAQDKLETTEKKDKIDKLRSLKVSDADISEVLDIPVEALEEKESDTQYSTHVPIGEPFLWLSDVLNDTVIDITVTESKSKTKLGTVQVLGKSILEQSNCTISRAKLKTDKIEIDYLAQARVVKAA
jgi:Ca2+-dependent lipid-binding protein